MNCDALLVYLSEYLDNQLDTELTQAAHAHLATCQNCQIVLNTTQQVIFLGVGQHQRTIPLEQRRVLYEHLQEAFLHRPNEEDRREES